MIISWKSPKENKMSVNGRSPAITLNHLTYQLSQHWLLMFSLIIGLYVGLPWLAPLFMELGWTDAGNAIYTLYKTQCHQLPQRSFFLFGTQPMYSLEDVQTVWQPGNNPLTLRQFIGNAHMGWKVAWSDRMVSMYSSLLLWSIPFALLRRRLKPLTRWGFILFLLPMLVDGVTHMVSDVTGGIGLGFRETNNWLAVLTNHSLPATFYVGDALGSFNSWMRLLTGLLFGLGVVWCLYPRLQASFVDTSRHIEAKFHQAGLEL
jgi:uncharacterized membrane protein